MSADRLKQAAAFVRAERERIWLESPTDLQPIMARLGAAGQNFTTVMYAEKDTGAMVKYMNILREASKGPGIELESLKKITGLFLGFDLRRLIHYYHTPQAQAVFDRAVDALPEAGTPAEYRELLEELMLYVGRLNYWIDLEIPWAEIGETYPPRSG